MAENGQNSAGQGGHDGPRHGDDFDSRLKAARTQMTAQRHDRGGNAEDRAQKSLQGAGAAMRVGLEMVSATLVGVIIGWLLDRWLGSAPWFLILFLFLGGAAGIYNVWRFFGSNDMSIGAGRPQDKTPPD